MKILFIGPLPDPITGQSLACEVLLDSLSKTHEVTPVNLSGPVLTLGHISASKLFSVIITLFKVWRARRAVDVIYLTISESVMGNIKDLLIYLICYTKLPCLMIHVHGGSIKTWVFDKYELLRRLNVLFLRKLGAVVVLGDSHVKAFADIVHNNRLHVVPNFAIDELFSSEERIAEKFADCSKIRVLFLSNFIKGKGYEQVVKAFGELHNDQQERIELDFAGAFESLEDESEFFLSINNNKNIRYHGVVQGTKKKYLLDHAHIFCLPTSLLEGQPISILEAYATGCVVMTTACGGIPDVFSDRVNGFLIKPNLPHSLRDVFAQTLDDSSVLLPIALNNFRQAETRYRTSRYLQDLIMILTNIRRDIS